MRRRPAPVSGRRLLVVLAGWPLGGGVLVGSTFLTLRAAAGSWAGGHPADVLAIALLEAYLALLAVLLLAFGGLAGVRDRLGFRFTSLSDLVLAGALWACGLAAGGLASALTRPLLGPARSNAVDLFASSRDPLFVGLVVPTVALLAPAAEELLFRGALFGWLRTRLPVAAAVGLSAAVFATAHLVPALLPIFFAFGVAAALVYQFTGSTFNSFAIHAAQNTLAVVAAYVVITRGVGS